MTELELLQKVDKVLQKRCEQSRMLSASTRKDPDSWWRAVVYDDGVAARARNVYCDFCALYEELGYTDEQIGAWRKEK